MWVRRRWFVIKRFSPGACVLWPGACLLVIALAGCDPIVTIAGASFPSWLICMIAGAILAAIFRPLLQFLHLESHLGPLTIFYPSLVAMFSMIAWIIFFNRV